MVRSFILQIRRYNLLSLQILREHFARRLVSEGTLAMSLECYPITRSPGSGAVSPPPQSYKGIDRVSGEGCGETRDGLYQ